MFEQSLPATRACRFGARLGVLVLWIEAATREPAAELATRIWGAADTEVTATRDLPPDARSIARLLIAQREVDGIFDAERPA